MKQQFTAKQRTIIALLAQGKTNDEIADTLGIRPTTAKAHVIAIRHKLGVEKRRQVPSAYTAMTGEVASTIEVPVAA